MTKSQKIEKLEEARRMMEEATNLVSDVFLNDANVEAYWTNQVQNHISGGNPYDLNLDKLIERVEDQRKCLSCGEVFESTELNEGYCWECFKSVTMSKEVNSRQCANCDEYSDSEEISDDGFCKPCESEKNSLFESAE